MKAGCRMKIKNIIKSVDKLLLCSITVCFTFVIGVITYIFPASTQVPIWVINIILIVGYIVCIVLYAIYSNINDAACPVGQGEVISISGTNRIILSESKHFTYNMLVTILFKGDKRTDYLRTLGYGFVENIQQDKKVVIKVLFLNEIEMTDANVELKNNKATTRNISVLPYIKKDEINIKEEIS